MATTNQLWKMFQCVNASSSGACSQIQLLNEQVTRCEQLLNELTTNNQALQAAPLVANLAFNGPDWAPTIGGVDNVYNFNGYVVFPLSVTSTLAPPADLILTVPDGFRPISDLQFSVVVFDAGAFVSPLMLRLSTNGELTIINSPPFAYPSGGLTNLTISYRT